MGFQFNKNLYDDNVRQKYLEAERARDSIYQKYPDIKEVDQYRQKLKKEYRLLQVQQLLSKSDSTKNATHSLDNLAEEIKALEQKYQCLLENYTIPTNFKEPKWDCPQCMDTGRILKNGVSFPCTCTFKHRREFLLNRSGLSKKLEMSSFQNLDLNLYTTEPMENSPKRSIRKNAELVFDAAKKFAYNFEENTNMRGLFIDGHVGSGKSYLLGCITNYLIDRDIEVQYVVYGDLIQTIKSSFNSNSQINSDEILKELQNVPVLLIDDLGTEYITDFTSSILYQIIDKRYREERPFIITSNFSSNELSHRMSIMGERIFDRIIETCRYFQLVGNVRDKIVFSRRGADQ
ncbi:MAG: ATP-binding protein [Halanaerobiales bacterium]|nr:ATP-binding protein [Halanaerobiales bacterium]